MAVCPAATVAEGLGAEMEKSSVPVPESATVRGLPTALSVIVSMPVLEPSVCGLKATFIVQLLRGARVPPELGHAPVPADKLNSPPFAPLIAMLVILSGVVSALLVIITVAGPPTLPTNEPPKERLDCERLTSETPVPDSGTRWGLPAALSAMARAALLEAADMGLKLTPITQVSPGRKVAPEQVSEVLLKSAGLVPPMVTPWMANDAEPAFPL